MPAFSRFPAVAGHGRTWTARSIVLTSVFPVRTPLFRAQAARVPAGRNRIKIAHAAGDKRRVNVTHHAHLTGSICRMSLSPLGEVRSVCSWRSRCSVPAFSASVARVHRGTWCAKRSRVFLTLAIGSRTGTGRLILKHLVLASLSLSAGYDPRRVTAPPPDSSFPRMRRGRESSLPSQYPANPLDSRIRGRGRDESKVSDRRGIRGRGRDESEGGAAFAGGAVTNRRGARPSRAGS